MVSSYSLSIIIIKYSNRWSLTIISHISCARTAPWSGCCVISAGGCSPRWSQLLRPRGQAPALFDKGSWHRKATLFFPIFQHSSLLFCASHLVFKRKGRGFHVLQAVHLILFLGLGLVLAPSHTFPACYTSFVAGFTACTFSYSLFCSVTPSLHLTVYLHVLYMHLLSCIRKCSYVVTGYPLATLQNTYIL